MKFKKRYLWCFIPLWIGCWTVVLVFGEGLPVGNGMSVDLSGRYTLLKSDLKGLSRWGHPFVNCNMLTEGSEVTVTQDGDHQVVFSCTWTNGFHKVNEIRPEKNGDFRWLDGCLLYTNKKSGIGAAILPGIRTLIRESRLTKRQNGDLQIDYTQREKGLALFLVPFQDSQKSSVVLRRSEEEYIEALIRLILQDPQPHGMPTTRRP